MQNGKSVTALLTCLLASFSAVLVSTGIFATEPKRGSTRSSEDRAVSLKVLESRAKSCMAQGKCPQHLLELCNLAKIYGYVKDVKNQDLILLGSVKPSLPPLYLEDFVIALRNAGWKYAPLKGNTYYYSSPGCSIDPDPETLLRLQQLGGTILSTTAKVESTLQRWDAICGQPQEVKVFGIPFHTRFAEIMVEADYFMKRIVDGSVSLDIEGFESLSDKALNQAKEDMIENRPISIPLLNRFWFFPGECRYLEDSGVVIVKKCEVKLLTEEQFLTRKGDVVGSGRADPLVQKFAEDFSRDYTQISEIEPIYLELESLFRFVTLAKIMESRGVLSEIGVDLDYLLNDYPIMETRVEATLPGLSHTKRFEHRRDYPGGYEIVQLALPSCGGVAIDIKTDDQNFVKDKTGQLLRLGEAVLKARTSSGALYWDFPANQF